MPKRYGIGEKNVKGLDQLLNKLQHLAKKTTRTGIARKALHKAMAPVQKKAKQKLVDNKSIETGLLKLSIGRRIRVYSQSGTVVAIVGPRTGFKRMGRGRKSRKGTVKSLYAKMMEHGKNGRPRMPSKYAHLVEFGTRPHTVGKGDRHPANVRRNEKAKQTGPMHPGARAKPFIRPAWDENRQASLATLAHEVGAGIEQAFRATS